VHALDGPRQKYGRLTCGVTATYHNDFFAVAQLRFDECRAVVHTCASVSKLSSVEIT